MYEKYSLIHYEFVGTGRGLPDTPEAAAMLENTGGEVYAEVLKADYLLRGWVDVLPVFPQADDAFRHRMHLQSFSHMYSGRGYYTSRKDAQSYLLIRTGKGRGILEYRDHTWALEEGDLFWIDCRKPNSYRTDGDFWEHTDIHINGSDAEDLYAAFEKNGSIVLKARSIPYFHHDTERLLDAYVSMDPHRSIKVMYAIETMLVHLITAEKSGQQNMPENTVRLQELARYMHEHYREPLTMEQLSEYCGFSRYHLSREFKKLTGFAPNEYLIRLRLEQAKFLLANTDLPVRSAAAMSGIENEAYFSRLFHQRTGMTPAEYRRAMRRQDYTPGGKQKDLR